MPVFMYSTTVLSGELFRSPQNITAGREPYKIEINITSCCSPREQTIYTISGNITVFKKSNANDLASYSAVLTTVLFLLSFRTSK